VEELEAKVVQQRKDFESTIATQQSEIANIVAGLKEQQAQIQRVRNEVALREADKRLVANEP
jgi:hypothetical protein